MVVSDKVRVSEARALKRAFTLPVCDGRLPVLGRRGHKEGRSDRHSCLRRELDISNLETQCEEVGVDSQPLILLYGSVFTSVYLNIRT